MHRRHLLASLLIVLAASACARGPAPTTAKPAAPLPDGVAAAAGTHALGVGELRELVIEETTRQQRSPPPCAAPAVCQEAPDLLVRRVLDERVGLLAAEIHAARSGVTITDAEVEAELDRIVLFAFQPKDTVLAASVEHGYRDFRRSIREVLLLGKLWAAGPGKTPLPELDSEPKRRAVLDAAYAKWAAAPEHQFVELRVLAFYPGDDPAYVERSLADLRRRADAGEEFCDLVRTYAPADDDKRKCGTDGPMPVTLFEPPIQRRIAAMKPMVVAGPVRFGQHLALLQITDTPKPRPLDHVRRELWEDAVRELQTRAIAKWLLDLRATYDVRVAPLDLVDLQSYVIETRRKVAPLAPELVRQHSWLNELAKNIVISP